MSSTMPRLPKLVKRVYPDPGEVLVLAAEDWMEVDARRPFATSGTRRLRLRVDEIDVAASRPYAGVWCWLKGTELGDDAEPIRRLRLLVRTVES